MGRLFWKFLLAFWLALLAAAVAVGLAVDWLHERAQGGPDRYLADPHAATVLSAATAALRHAGAPGLKDFLVEQAQRDPRPVYGVDDRGGDLGGRPVQAGDLAWARRLADSGEPLAPARRVQVGSREWLLFMPTQAPGKGPPPLGLAGPGGPHVPPPGPLGERPGPPPVWLPLGTALLASLLFSAMLAWYVAGPIGRLRAATRAVAAGQLDIRIGPDLGGRRDELAELGRDFDAMTGRLGELIGAQRRLFHDVSHELRSPLARMHAAIGLARQDPGRLEETLERLEREAGRLDELVGEVLTLARLDSRMAGGEETRFDLSDLLEAIVEDARFEGEPLGLEVSFRGLGAAPMGGHPDLVGRALENVLRNALQHSTSGQVVEVECRRRGGDGSPDPVWVVSVCDRGPGVPAEELEHIFEPFHRGRRTGPGGYGLGLAIARRAVQAHGGVIRAENRPGGGLCVETELPGAG